MIDWIRKSFRNRIFASVMLITLLPILLSNILLLSYQVRQTGRDQSLSAEEMLTDSHDRLCELTGQMNRVAETLARSTVVHSVLRRGSGDSIRFCSGKRRSCAVTAGWTSACPTDR